MRLTLSREHLLLSFILLFALSTRLTVFFANLTVNPTCYMDPDSYEYDGAARALLELHRFADSPEKPGSVNIRRTPGFPLFIAAHYAAFGENPIPVIVTQILVSAAILALMYLIGRIVFGETVGLVAAALLALEYNSFTLSQLLMAETLFTFLIVAGLYAGLRTIIANRHRGVWGVVMGLALAAATQVRPASYYLTFPLLAGYWTVGHRNGWSSRQRLSISLGLLLPWLVLVGGWQWRNHRLTGFGGLSTIQAHNMLYAKGAEIKAWSEHIPLATARETLQASVPQWARRTPQEEALWMREEGRKLLMAHPVLLLRSVLRALARMMLLPGESELLKYLGLRLEQTGAMGDLLRLPIGAYVRKWPIGNPFLFSAFLLAAGYLYLLYAGIALCAYQLWKERRSQAWAVHAFLWGVGAYFCLASTVTEAYPRYRIPVMPVLCLYGAAGILQMVEWFGGWIAKKAP